MPEYKLSYTASEINQKLDEIDSLKNLIVDSELSSTSHNPVQNKIVTEKFNELSSEKVSINQGSTNVGKIFVVGADGNLTLADMPEGDASGDDMKT